MDINLTDEGIKALKSILNKIQLKEVERWILHDGSEEPEVPVLKGE